MSALKMFAKKVDAEVPKSLELDPLQVAEVL